MPISLIAVEVGINKESWESAKAPELINNETGINETVGFWGTVEGILVHNNVTGISEESGQI